MLLFLQQGFRDQERAQVPARQDEEQAAAGGILAGEPERREAAEIIQKWWRTTQLDEGPERLCRNPETLRVQERRGGREEGATEPKRQQVWGINFHDFELDLAHKIKIGQT